MYKSAIVRAFSLIAATLFSYASSVAHASILGFGDFTSWTINQNDSASSSVLHPAPLPGGAIQLTTNASGEDRSIFYDTPQPISSFTASFTLQMTNGGTPRAAFVLQDTAAATHAIGASLGYQGMDHSIAVSLEPSSFSGFYSDGSVGGGAVSTAPVDFSTDDPVQVTLSYDGTFLKETLLDLTTSAVFQAEYSANLFATIGGSSAYVGITSTDSTGSSVETFSNFTFTSVPEPSSIIMLSLGAIATVACRMRRCASTSDQDI